MAETAGVGSTVGMIESELENATDSNQPGVDLVANVVQEILEEEGNGLDTWEEFSQEVEAAMSE